MGEKRNLLVQLITFLITCSISFSCNKSNSKESRVKTLDEVSGNGFVPSNCRGKIDEEFEKEFSQYIEKGFVRVPETLLQDLKETMAAVPKKLRLAFFDRVGHNDLPPLQGSIVINSDADEKCPTSDADLKDNEARFFRACWREKPPVIYIEEKVAAIKHSLLRLLLYVYSEFALNQIELLLPNDRSLGLRNRMIDFSAVFLKEIAEKSLSESEINRNVKKEDARAFAEYVLAEAMDSYYCSKETNDAFKTAFPLTYNFFMNAEVFGDKKTFADIFGPPQFVQ